MVRRACAILAVLCGLCGAVWVARAQTIEQCHGIADADRRVACYRAAPQPGGPPVGRGNAGAAPPIAPAPPAGGEAGNGFVVLALLGLVYLAPALIAFARNARRLGGIAALNILLGWTFLGWALAFVWAVSDERSRPAPPEPAASRGANGARKDATAPDIRRMPAEIDDGPAGPAPARRELAPEIEARARAMARRAYPSAIVGLRHAGPNGEDRGAALSALGPGAVLRLEPEPDNPHDPDAVAVLREGAHLGYVPRRAEWIIEALDEGDVLAAVLLAVDEVDGRAIAARMLVLVLADGPG